MSNIQENTEDFNAEFERFMCGVDILAESDEWIITAVHIDGDGNPVYTQYASSELAAGTLLAIGKQMFLKDLRQSFDNDTEE